LDTPAANGTSTAVGTAATAGTLATADTSIAVRTTAAAETPETARDHDNSWAPSNANSRSNIGHSGVKSNSRDNSNIKVSNFTRNASNANQETPVKKFPGKLKIRIKSDRDFSSDKNLLIIGNASERVRY
jgi:hypothetical protein